MYIVDIIKHKCLSLNDLKLGMSRLTVVSPKRSLHCGTWNYPSGPGLLRSGSEAGCHVARLLEEI